MDLDELPLDLMHKDISSPTQEGMDFIESLCVPIFIERSYESLENKADAYDGAFLGYHIHMHLSAGEDKETWLGEMLLAYRGGYNDFKGAFYAGLKAVLDGCGLTDFYKEAIHYIVKEEGSNMLGDWMEEFRS